MRTIKKSFLIIIIVFLLNCILYLDRINLENKTVIENKNTILNKTSAISMMYETDAGSGIYEVSTDNSWPTEGYTFNERLSKCENGSKLTWNDATKTVVFSGNISDKCYVYFDYYDNKITFTIGTVTYYAESEMTWNEWLNSEYNTDEYYYSGKYGITEDKLFTMVVTYENGKCHGVEPEDIIINGNSYAALSTEVTC